MIPDAMDMDLDLASSRVQVANTPELSFSLSADHTQPDETLPPARTPSPPPVNNLYSSPPTPPKFPRENTDSLLNLPTDSQLIDVSNDELRQLVSQLSIHLRDARTSAAHHQLQRQMLSIESSNQKNALMVENGMLQRELEVLQNGEKMRSNQAAQQSAERELIVQLNDQITGLNEDRDRQRLHIARLENSLSHYSAQVATLEARLASVEEKNERLCHRIRTNRDHMNGLIESARDRSPNRSAAAAAAAAANYHNTPGPAPSIFTTPARSYHVPMSPHTTGSQHHPYHHPSSTTITPSRRRTAANLFPYPQLTPTATTTSLAMATTTTTPSAGKRESALEYLLLADKVISQEASAAPSTPPSHNKRSRGHHRAAMSMSSIPATPKGRSIATMQK